MPLSNRENSLRGWAGVPGDSCKQLTLEVLTNDSSECLPERARSPLIQNPTN
jgi:hypothetical protein